MYYVYILKLDNNDFYIGFTTDLQHRLSQHRSSKSYFTSRSKSHKLVCYIAFDSKLKAEKFEKYLKTGSGQAFRNKRLI